MWPIFNLSLVFTVCYIILTTTTTTTEAQHGGYGYAHAPKQQYGYPQPPQQQLSDVEIYRSVKVNLASPIVNNYLPPAPAPAPTAVTSYDDDPLTKLFRLICSTFKKMTDHALADNFEIGCRIEKILKWEAEKAGQILYEYKRLTRTPITTPASKPWDPNRRYKRQAKTCANGVNSNAMNDMGQILVDSNSNIGAEKKRLKRDTQKNINNEYKNGVSNCAADSCKAAGKILDSVDDDSERQR